MKIIKLFNLKEKRESRQVFNSAKTCFCRKVKVLVTIISTRWRMYRSVRFTLAIIATSASSRSTPLCRGLLATCSSVKNPQDPSLKLSGEFLFLMIKFFKIIITENLISLSLSLFLWPHVNLCQSHEKFLITLWLFSLLLLSVLHTLRYYIFYTFINYIQISYYN